MKGIEEYQKVELNVGIMDADPHRIIQLLLEGVLFRLSLSKQHIVEKNYDKKAKYIGKSMDIINGLRASLNLDEGGKLSNDLNNLYEYMVRRLLQASKENNVSIIDEVVHLITNIKSAWDTIPQNVRDGYAEEMKNNVMVPEG